MQIRSINDPSKILTWDIRSSKWEMKSQAVCRSKIQYSIGQLIKGKYPFDQILEDITIPDTRLSLDFFIPARRLAFEIQGKQHNQRNSFFHKSNMDFINQQTRDNTKKEFCELNNIKLVTLDNLEQAKEFLN